MDAREVCITITGAHKSIALAKCIEEGVNHMWTVSAIQMHPKGLVVCDEDATLELHVKVCTSAVKGAELLNKACQLNSHPIFRLSSTSSLLNMFITL